ncbi:MAG: oxalurate catabolism protein HpxZ [Pseudomonadota bacterium]
MIINDPDTLAEVEAAFERYEAALLVNDTDELASMFWDSEKTIRYGVNDHQEGAAALAAFRALGPSTDPNRALLNTRIATYGTEFATAWTQFESPSQPGKIGRQSQTWVKIEGAWKVVTAHVSVIDAEP